VSPLACFFLLFIFNFSVINARSVVVHNMTDKDLFAAIYYVKSGIAYRTDAPVAISPGDSQKLEKPKWSFKKERWLVFDHSVNALCAQECLASHVLGGFCEELTAFNGNEFFIKQTEMGLDAYPWFYWKVVTMLGANGNLASLFSLEQVKQQIKSKHPFVVNNPYKDVVAFVRQGKQLCHAEYEALVKRRAKVKKAIEELVGYPVGEQNVPTIAIVTSGGGDRASLMTLGSLIGAEKTGILDCVSYIATLSGSTWAVATWLTSGRSLQEHRDMIVRALEISIDEMTPQEVKVFLSALMVKLAYGQPITLVDYWGAMVGTRLMRDRGDQVHYTRLSDQRMRVSTGDYPLPIYTLVRAEEHAQFNSWYECTPWEFGGAWLNCYIPTWACGRRFFSGNSLDDSPEQPLAFYLGAFGSAFSARLNQIYFTFQEWLGVQQMRVSLEERILDAIGNKRIIPAAEIFNFAAGVVHGPMRGQKTMQLVDAGAWPGFNLPYPPISDDRPERRADIIIFLDNSAVVKMAPELNFAQEYAYVKGYDFPPIDYYTIDRRIMSCFWNHCSPESPVIIYMPRINDLIVWHEVKDDPEYAPYGMIEGIDLDKETAEGFAKTFVLSYDPLNALRLSTIGEFNMVVSASDIKDVIREWVRMRIERDGYA
jgi:hypothetical protein